MVQSYYDQGFPAQEGKSNIGAQHKCVQKFIRLIGYCSINWFKFLILLYQY